jgi:hypothetical protein
MSTFQAIGAIGISAVNMDRVREYRQALTDSIENIPGLARYSGYAQFAQNAFDDLVAPLSIDHIDAIKSMRDRMTQVSAGAGDAANVLPASRNSGAAVSV